MNAACGRKGKAMPKARRHYYLWRVPAFAAAILLIACLGVNAKESSASMKEAEQYVAKGDLKGAEIELRNAVRQSPQDPVIRARLAQVYLNLGDTISAEREARAARERKGDEADYLPILTEALLRQGKFSDVVDLVQPDDRTPALESKVRSALGAAAVGLNDRKKAEAMFRDAMRLDPAATQPKVRLAELLNRQNPEEADKLIDSAIAGNPHSAEILQVKGEMLQTRGDQDGAMRLFEEALAIDPKNLQAHLGRANINIGRGKFKAADEDLDPILKASPNNFTANFLRALALAKQQQYAAADRIFDRISPAFPRFWTGYYLQGATKLALGQSAQAESILSKYLAHVPTDQRASHLIASAALQQHAPSRAIEYLKPLADKSAADAATLSLLGNAYMAAGKPELALQQFEKAAALDPGDQSIKARVAISEINSGRGQQGLAELEQVFASASGATVAGPALVLSELRAGRVEKAAEVADSLIKLDADNPLYQTLLGVVKAAQRDNAGAETAFRAALARNPDFAAATSDLAKLYLATRRPDDAKKVYSDLLSKKSDDGTALLGLADVAITQKKWPEAIDYINRARTAAPNDPAAGIKLVNVYEMRQDWSNARTVAGELVAQFPRDVNVEIAQAAAFLGSGDTNSAISSYKRAYEIAPDSIPILSRYVALLISAKQFREAHTVLQEAIARDPRNASLKADLIRVESEIDGLDAGLAKASSFAKDDPDPNIYDLVSAELYEKAGRPQDAIALLEKAVTVRPSDDNLTIALSRLYTSAGDLTKAEAVLTGRLATDPKSPTVRTALARLYLTTGRTDKAKKSYDELLSQEPTDVAVLLGLAEIAVTQKKWPEAKDYAKRARTVAPKDPAPGLFLVNMYGLQQNWKDARSAADELAAEFPANVDVLDAQGRVQIAAGDKDGALSTYKRAHELAPGSKPILSRYVTLLKAAKNFSEERTVLEAALDRDPQNTSLKTDLIRVGADIGGLEAGLAKARGFANADPGNSLYDVVSAELYENAGRRPQAIALLDRVAATRPSDDNLTIALFRMYSRVDDLAKAEAVLNDRLKADATDFAVRSILAGFYLEQKRYDPAIAEYTRLIAERPADPAALNNLAWLYQRQGDLTKARELAERAFAAAPAAAQIDDTLGWILLAQGETDKAVTHLSAANSAAPRNPDIQYHLAVALQRVGRPADAQAMLETLLGSGVSFADKAEAEKLLQELKHG
jgi:putative PEP-CTERM system TPR-repeat lipoprotein